MRQYEIMLILDPSVEDRAVQSTVDNWLKIITKEGGNIDNVDIWGKRRLTFEINKKSEGIYAVIGLHANSSSVLELDRVLRLNEKVLRTKVLRKEK